MSLLNIITYIYIFFNLVILYLIIILNSFRRIAYWVFVWWSINIMNLCLVKLSVFCVNFKYKLIIIFGANLTNGIVLLLLYGACIHDHVYRLPRYV